MTVRPSNLVLLFAVLGGSASPKACEAAIPAFSFQFGNRGPGAGQFMTPSGLATFGTTVAVSDVNNNRVQIFNSAGQFQAEFGEFGSDEHEFTAPFELEIGPNGDYVIADTLNNRVKRHDSSGAFKSFVGASAGISLPQGVVADNQGNLFIADTGNNRVLKFDSEGDLVQEIGGPGLAAGQFITPRGLALDNSGNLLVADSKNHRVQKFDQQGNFVSKFGQEGDGNGQFMEPFSIAVDSQDRIYVSDSLNHRLQIFNADGEYRGQIGDADSESGTEPSKFNNPFGVSIGPNDSLYVADGLNDRVQVFVQTPDGDYNGNGSVDASDYALWLTTLGEQTDLRADGNENGSVDPDDYGVWRDNVGVTSLDAVSSSSSAEIPEPASLLIIIISVALLSVIRLPLE